MVLSNSENSAEVVVKLALFFSCNHLTVNQLVYRKIYQRILVKILSLIFPHIFIPSKLETEIDRMVYDLYELTEEEILIVEGK